MINVVKTFQLSLVPFINLVVLLQELVYIYIYIYYCKCTEMYLSIVHFLQRNQSSQTVFVTKKTLGLYVCLVSG